MATGRSTSRPHARRPDVHLYRAGAFYPRVRVVDDQGAAVTAAGLVQVLDRAALETLLQARWSGLRDALSRADVPAAVALFAGASRDAYAISSPRWRASARCRRSRLPSAPSLRSRCSDRAAEYELKAVQRGTLYSFHVLFVIDTDGVWRLRVF